MKGVLFNVVEDVVTAALGHDTWDDVVETSGVSGAYTSLGNYPDGELVAIVVALSEKLSLSVDDTLRLAGRLGFEPLASRAPELLSSCPDWRSVLTSLDDIIHPEVLKIYPDSDVPRFSVVDGDDAVTVHYSSERGMCALADGLLVGCGAWYSAELEVEHVTCVHRGDDTCTMRVSEAS